MKLKSLLIVFIIFMLNAALFANEKFKIVKTEHPEYDEELVKFINIHNAVEFNVIVEGENVDEDNILVLRRKENDPSSEFGAIKYRIKIRRLESSINESEGGQDFVDVQLENIIPNDKFKEMADIVSNTFKKDTVRLSVDKPEAIVGPFEIRFRIKNNVWPKDDIFPATDLTVKVKANYLERKSSKEYVRKPKTRYKEIIEDCYRYIEQDKPQTIDLVGCEIKTRIEETKLTEYKAAQLNYTLVKVGEQWRISFINASQNYEKNPEIKKQDLPESIITNKYIKKASIWDLNVDGDAKAAKNELQGQENFTVAIRKSDFISNVNYNLIDGVVPNQKTNPASKITISDR